VKLNSSILCTAYFPPIKYFQYLHLSQNVYIEHKEYYKRHSIRNRALILGPNNVLLLTVPIVKKNSSKTFMENIRIANNDWKKKHIQSIKTAYGSSPFFIYYFEEIKEIINKNHTFLIDFNYEILYYFLNELNIKTNLKKTESYIKNYENQCCDERDNIEMHQSLKKYTQIFTKNFIPNLSIIDLIFNLGPNSKEYIYTS